MKERWHPSVPLARRIGRELGADVMVLVRSESGRWCGASWGRTMARCASMGAALDRVFDARLLDGVRCEVCDGARLITCDCGDPEHGCGGGVPVECGRCDGRGVVVP